MPRHETGGQPPPDDLLIPGLNPDHEPRNNHFLHSFDNIDSTVITRVGGKAKHLVLLRAAGLPVPPGFCVPTDAHEQYLETGSLPEGLVDEITRAKEMLGG